VHVHHIVAGAKKQEAANATCVHLGLEKLVVFVKYARLETAPNAKIQHRDVRPVSKDSI
jgi:hypothetical protein